MLDDIDDDDDCGSVGHTENTEQASHILTAINDQSGNNRKKTALARLVNEPPSNYYGKSNKLNATISSYNFDAHRFSLLHRNKSHC